MQWITLPQKQEVVHSLIRREEHCYVVVLEPLKLEQNKLTASSVLPKIRPWL